MQIAKIVDLLARYSRHVEFIGVDLASIDQVGAFGSQVLHLASFAGHCEDVKEAITAGADINSIGDLGLSPLHYAILGGRKDVIRLLVAQGADLGAKNEFGETPLQMARLMGQSDIESLLRDLGSSPTFGSDCNVAAKERWAEFRSIQEENFWSE